MDKNTLKKIFEFIAKENEEIQSIGKILGNGAFGEVREILINKKVYAGKLLYIPL